MFISNALGKSKVLGRNGDPLGVQRAKVRIFHQVYQVHLTSFLQAFQGAGLKTDALFRLLRQLTDQAPKGSFPEQQLRGPLQPADLAHGAHARF